MCFAVYIGTDMPLTTSEWDDTSRQVYLAPLAEKDEPVRRLFSKTHVYYAGSHLQCSCGFFHNTVVFTDDPKAMEEYKDSQRSAHQLIQVLNHALLNSETVEMFVTWEGRQGEAPSRTRTMVPDDLLTPLQPYSTEADDEVRMAASSVDEQDFIVIRRNKERRTNA
jgi:hypothetical protein